ncbi:MAG: hypothetical protein HYS98_05285 [Deltaproteobacteria bacterium]|nr:hypothetical protein [Deltaproteobacteria bacterium]
MTEHSKKKTEVGQEEGLRLGDVAKKAFYTGLGALFMTEETVRNLVSEMKVPKDALLENFKKTKQDFFHLITREVHQAISRLDIPNELQKFLETHSVHINAEFKKKQ